MTESSHDAAGEWMGFARELATMEDLVTRLLIEHVPDDAGRCTCCTTPGPRHTPTLLAVCTVDARQDRATDPVDLGSRPGRHVGAPFAATT